MSIHLIFILDAMHPEKLGKTLTGLIAKQEPKNKAKILRFVVLTKQGRQQVKQAYLQVHKDIIYRE